MPTAFRTSNQTLCIKIEDQQGVDAVPTVAANAILVETPTAPRKLENIDSNEVTGSLSSRGALPGGASQGVTGIVYFKGADTIGQAPEYGPALRICGMAETVLAADAAGMVTVDADGVLTLAAVPAHAPQPGQVVEVTAGTGVGQLRVIQAWDAGTKALTCYPDFDIALDATSAIAIKAGASYVPASTALETGTIYRFRHSTQAGGQSKLDIGLGMAGTFKLDVAARQQGKLTFTFTGIMTDSADVANPGPATYDACKAPALLAAKTYFGGAKLQLNSFTLDLAATVSQADDPSALFGYDVGSVAARKVTGSFDAPVALKSVRDALADWAAGNTRPLWLCWGSIPGARVSVYIPACAPNTDDEKDDGGNAYETNQFRAEGIDSEFVLTVF